jgi:hypothetical protein
MPGSFVGISHPVGMYFTNGESQAVGLGIGKAGEARPVSRIQSPRFAKRATGFAVRRELQRCFQLIRRLADLTLACQRVRKLLVGFPLDLRRRIRG